jgi:hypothetical protein
MSEIAGLVTQGGRSPTGVARQSCFTCLAGGVLSFRAGTPRAPAQLRVGSLRCASAYQGAVPPSHRYAPAAQSKAELTS